MKESKGLDLSATDNNTPPRDQPVPEKTFIDYVREMPHEVLVEAIAKGTEHVIAAHAKRWVAQSPQTPLAQVLEWIREEKAADAFDRKNWDHHSPNYKTGRSNKAVKMWAATLSGDADLTMDESWELVERLAMQVEKRNDA